MGLQNCKCDLPRGQVPLGEGATEREVEKMFCADHVGEQGTDIIQMERIK